MTKKRFEVPGICFPCHTTNIHSRVVIYKSWNSSTWPRFGSKSIPEEEEELYFLYGCIGHLAAETRRKLGRLSRSMLARRRQAGDLRVSAHCEGLKVQNLQRRGSQSLQLPGSLVLRRGLVHCPNQLVLTSLRRQVGRSRKVAVLRRTPYTSARNPKSKSMILLVARIRRQTALRRRTLVLQTLLVPPIRRMLANQHLLVLRKRHTETKSDSR